MTDARFGNAAVLAGDINQDGQIDLFVGAPGEDVRQVESAGKVYLIDGKTGDVLRSFHSPNPVKGGFFGAKLSAVGDVTGDGKKDLLVGSPHEEVRGNEDAGRAYLFSGNSGKVVKKLAAPQAESSQFGDYEGSFGTSVASASDINDDGIPDFFVSAPEETVEDKRNTGTVYLFSGATGDLLRRFVPPVPQKDLVFGSTISHLGNKNKKTSSLLAVGAYRKTDDQIGYRGNIFLFSCASGDQVGTLHFPDGDAVSTSPHGLSVTSIRDVTGDGRSDALLTSPSSSRVFLVNSRSENVLETYSPPRSNLSAFGDPVAPTGDVDGDGVPDILVSARKEKTRDTKEAGQIYLFSGKDSSPVITFSSPNSTDRGSFGASLATSVNPDGSTDIFVGADQESVSSNFENKPEAGRVYHYNIEGAPLASTKQSDAPSDTAPSSGTDKQAKVRRDDQETSAQPSTKQQSPRQQQQTAKTKASPSTSVQVDTNVPSTGMNRPNDIAVIIGNKDYQNPDIPDVEYAVRDAQIMKKYLVQALGFREENVIYAENATAARMTRIFGSEDNPKGKLYNWVKPNESDVFVYYSGHGAPNPETGDAYFIPSNTNPSYLSQNGYPASQLYENLAKIPAQSTTVVVEACFSGTSEGGAVVQDVSPAVLNVENPLVGMKNTLAFTAGAADQVSTWYNEKKHGLFTYYFLKGLRGTANANGDRAVTAREMEAYLREKVPYRARRLHNREQIPQVIGQNKDRILVRYNDEMPAQTQVDPRLPVTTTKLKESVEKTLSLANGAKKVTQAPTTTSLQKGDVILSANGKDLNQEDRLGQIVSSHSPGDELTLRVFRNGSVKTISVTLDAAQ